MLQYKIEVTSPNSKCDVKEKSSLPRKALS